jgi:hypothetical protein
MMAIGKLPVDAATLLRDVADWLDRADMAFEKLCRQRDMRWDSTPDIQDDVRRLAEWFAANPHVDVAAFGSVTGGWDPSSEPVAPPDPAVIVQRLRALAV